MMFNAGHIVRCLCLIAACLAAGSGIHAEDLLPNRFSDPAAIEQRLQQVQMELQHHAQDSDPLTQALLERLETAVYEHKATVDSLASLESNREQAVEAVRSWSGFEQPAPYSIQFADKLSMQLISLEHLQHAAAARIHIINLGIEDASDQLAAYQSSERQFTEQVEAAGMPEARRQALVSTQHAGISSRIQAEKLAYLGMRERVVQIELATFEAGQELLELQLNFIEDQTTFTESELQSILHRIAGERAQAFKTLNSVAGNEQGSDVRLAWLAEFLDTEEEFWKARYKALSGASLVEQEKALEAFKAMSETVDDWDEIGKALASSRQIGKGESTGEQLLHDDLQRIARLQNQIKLAIDDVEGSALRGMSLLGYVTDAAYAVWDAELYLVEDISSIDGQRVTTYRAITLGKLLRLVIILTIGWFLLKFLSRKVRMLISGRPGISPGTAKSVSRWIFGVGLALLIIYGLNRARIPFTAFAFLGGTLAIGIGFGAQTLLKNFISGIILKLERPFKVGDFIEVEDVTGRIQSIGLRASVIEHFDGIDTLVPNSALLEGRVNNWTYGKTALRGTVSVGVAYGSAKHDVSRALLNVAHVHGQVLEDPEPEVRFEDFGDNALIFELLYWVDATRINRKRLASDLRYMIDNALAEAGIAVPYPQRDIHFDSTRPLRVEVSTPGE